MMGFIGRMSRVWYFVDSGVWLGRYRDSKYDLLCDFSV